jgi:hypothetical protein
VLFYGDVTLLSLGLIVSNPVSLSIPH